MADSTLDAPDAEWSKEKDSLVRDYLLYQLQLNLLHGKYQDKAPDEAVMELMEAKREMQDKEAEVARKFTALNERYAHINGAADTEMMKNIENFNKMKEEVERLLTERKAALDAFNGDADAFLANYQAQKERLAQLEQEVRLQEENIAALYDSMLVLNFDCDGIRSR